MILAHIMAFRRTRFGIPEGTVNGLCALICVLYYVGLVAFVIATIVIYDANRKPARGQEYPNCSEFGFQIANTCCCTNDCCREAEPGEFQHLRGDLYRSSVTGQLVNRTGWSPDGRTVKCACDLGDQGRWFKHPKANVRCLFVPRPMM